MEQKEQKEELIKEIIMAEERAEVIRLGGTREKVWDILTKEKKFLPQEIEIDPTFRLAVGDCEFTTSIDFIIHLPEGSFIAIKCVSTAIESWERYVVSFTRTVKDYQIPYAAVTDGDSIRIIDVLGGTLVSESFEGLFLREEAMSIMKDFKKIPCSISRIEKEKRIVYAFEGTKCPPLKK